MFMQYFFSKYDALRPLTLVLKRLLEQGAYTLTAAFCSFDCRIEGLNEPYKGGLGGYGLILLIVSLMQVRFLLLVFTI